MGDRVTVAAQGIAVLGFSALPPKSPCFPAPCSLMPGSLEPACVVSPEAGAVPTRSLSVPSLPRKVPPQYWSAFCWLQDSTCPVPPGPPVPPAGCCQNCTQGGRELLELFSCCLFCSVLYVYIYILKNFYSFSYIFAITKS